MLNDALKRLDNITQSHLLDGMEVGVWAGIETQSREKRLSRVVMGWQTAVLALALVSSIGVGARAATSLPTASLGIFSPHASLAPSALLGGH
jgi:hypothetical protein